MKRKWPKRIRKREKGRKKGDEDEAELSGLLASFRLGFIGLRY